MSKISTINRINLETKATNFVKAFDTRGGLLNKPEALTAYSEFLKEKIKNPVGMGIAIKNVLEKNPIDDVIEFSSNIAYVEQDKGIKDLLRDVRQAELKNYARTQDIREGLIENNRINHERVMPALKGFEKFLLKLKLFMP